MFGGGSGAFHSGDGAGEAEPISLNLTALMDILSNLLFFLLASYTTQALEVEQKADLRLPRSTSQTKLQPELTVTVTKKEIKVAEVPIAAVEGDRIAGDSPDGDRIVALYDRLQSVKAARAAAGREGAASEVFLLLADRSLDSALVTRVLKTAGHAGFVNVRFGVIAQ